MRNSHAVLNRASVRSSRPAIAPVGTLENDLPLGLASGTRIDLLAEGERIHFELDGDFVDGLFKCEATLRVAGGAECRAGTGVHKDVVLFGEQVGALIQIGCGTGGAGSGAYACSTVAD